MSHPLKALPGMLFSSVLYNDSLFNKAEFLSRWKEQYGESIEFFHSFFPMKEYYSKEMGEESSLKRFFIFALTSVDRQKLVDAKLWAYDFEKKFMQEDKRLINIDPGILTLEQMILSTFKSYSHRIYLDRGVFADLNYIFKDKSYQKLEWTYPDYAHPEIIEAFNHMRGMLQLEMN